MYILDTNVLSELRKFGTNCIDYRFAAWATQMNEAYAYVSVITIMEIEQGIVQIERRDVRQGEMLRSWMDQKVLPMFSNKILPVDLAVALCCARLHVPNKCNERDALVAATALIHGMSVVTRNVKDFEPTGVPVINPWATTLN